jgi:hypothetical protein
MVQMVPRTVLLMDRVDLSWMREMQEGMEQLQLLTAILAVVEAQQGFVRAETLIPKS